MGSEKTCHLEDETMKSATLTCYSIKFLKTLWLGKRQFLDLSLFHSIKSAEHN